VDTIPFQQNSLVVSSFGFMPEFWLKKYVLDSFPQKTDAPHVIDFVVEMFDTLGGSVIGSRLALNCLQSPIGEIKLDQKKMTFIDSHDEVVLPTPMRQRLYDRFPDVRVALMKEGGDFPYLAEPSDISMYITVHLRGQGLYPNLDEDDKTAPASPAAATQAQAVETSAPTWMLIPETVRKM
jgi:maspardin